MFSPFAFESEGRCFGKASTTARDIDVDPPGLCLDPTGPTRVQNANIGVLTGPIRVQILSPKVLGFQRECLEVIGKYGGDDGARTRDLRRDRFAFWANQIMDLLVLSAACERQGPTWNAIKCPKTIHLVHTYCTHIFVPEYLHWSLFESSLHSMLSGFNILGATAVSNTAVYSATTFATAQIGRVGQNRVSVNPGAPVQLTFEVYEPRRGGPHFEPSRMDCAPARGIHKMAALPKTKAALSVLCLRPDAKR